MRKKFLREEIGSFTAEGTIVIYISVFFIIIFLSLFFKFFSFFFNTTELRINCKLHEENYISEKGSGHLLLENKISNDDGRIIIRTISIKFLDVFNSYFLFEEVGGDIIEIFKEME